MLGAMRRRGRAGRDDDRGLRELQFGTFLVFEKRNSFTQRALRPSSIHVCIF